MPVTKIHFVKDGQRIPFSQFLTNEKKLRAYTWRELDKLCGTKRINAYVLAMTNGEPNNPTYEKFLRIINALGYHEHDFEIKGLLKEHEIHSRITHEKYEIYLRRLGDNILQQNEENKRKGIRPQKLSVPAIRTLLGHDGPNFYYARARNYESRLKLHKDLLSLDPKYSSIKLQHQDQSDRASPRRLKNIEKESLEDSILEFMSRKESINDSNLSFMSFTDSPQPDRLPRGLVDFATRKLNTLLKERDMPTRAKSSIQDAVNKFWLNRRETNILKRGSPRSSDERIIQLLNEQLDELQESRDVTPELQNLKNSIVEKDDNKHRRKNYQNYATPGHTNLIVFLLDPDNYEEYISRDVELFDVDFPTSEIDEPLLSVYKEKIDILKARSKEFPDDADVIDFVDNWLRCDMVFRKRGGGFVVVEVKQYAIDKPNGFKNATKACQQLSAYTAVILDNILRHNLNNFTNPNYRSVKESVEGYLVAYEMDVFIQNHLNRAGNKRPVIIPKAVVDNYVKKLHDATSLSFDRM